MGKATRGVELVSLDDIEEVQIVAWMKQITSIPGVGTRPARKGSATPTRMGTTNGKSTPTSSIVSLASSQRSRRTMAPPTNLQHLPLYRTNRPKAAHKSGRAPGRK